MEKGSRQSSLAADWFGAQTSELHQPCRWLAYVTEQVTNTLPRSKVRVSGAGRVCDYKAVF